MGLDQAIVETMETWGKIKPLQHLSNTEIGMENESYTKRRAHSEYIHYIPDPQLKLIRENIVDVDIEAKHKNLALFKMRKDFNVEV
jgi:UV DNA damage repair endonuclease